MAAPKFAPVDPVERPRVYTSPDYIADQWLGGRPGDFDGRQPTGPLLGYQGPDQGYALTLAERLRPTLQLQPGESADDALHGAVAIALRRASLYGRAPVIHDLNIALTIWGFLDPSPPADLVARRKELFKGVSTDHGYFEARHIADAVLESTLRMTPQQAAAEYPEHWHDLTGA